MPLIYMFGAAISTIIIQSVVRRLYDNAHKHYVKTLNPPAETSGEGLSAYQRGAR